MRLSPTNSEARLWRALRAQMPELELRRQVPIGRYIVDLLVPEWRLVIEVDGGWHERRRCADQRRERRLVRAGYRVIRFSDEEVMRDVSAVVAAVKAALAAG